MRINTRLVVFTVTAIVICVSIITWYINSHIKDEPSPSPPVPAEPLQLGDLQVHTFEDMSFSIAYPSDWTKLESDAFSPITIESEERCGGLPLVVSGFRPYKVSSNGFQGSINDTVSLYVQTEGFTLIQQKAITYGGLSFVEVIISENSSSYNELWNVMIFFLSEDDKSKFSLTVSYCTPDCWEYFKDAVYTVTSTYQFLY